MASKAQDIVNQILGSEEYRSSRAFADRVFKDEPLVRTGADVRAQAARTPAENPRASAGTARAKAATTAPHGASGPGKSSRRVSAADARAWIPPAKTETGQAFSSYVQAREQANSSVGTQGTSSYAAEERLPIPAWAREEVERAEQAHTPMPAQYRKMRALARSRSMRAYRYGTGAARLFYEQGKLMEDFEDDFAGQGNFHMYYPTYEEMSDYQLRMYFSWRTRFRAGDTPPTSVSFLFVYAYEILCGIGIEPGERGVAELRRLRDAYGDTASSLGAHLTRWIHDYVVYWGLSPELLTPLAATFSVQAVGVALKAQQVLLAQGANTPWPVAVPGRRAAWPEGLPEAEDLLDALCSLSRYRAEKSRFVKAHHADAAEVVAAVFARMVAHCHKRRKTDYMEGLFGNPVRVSYSMFASAVFWAPEPHADAEYVAGSSESFVCEHGFWWRVLPCRRLETNRELGNLLHAVDCRMRMATGDTHTLKPRSLPKYQAKFVDEEIAALLERRAAEEAARVDIDRSALRHIRSASARTREALLTDEERGIEDVSHAVSHVVPVREASASPAAAREGEHEVVDVGELALDRSPVAVDTPQQSPAGPSPEVPSIASGPAAALTAEQLDLLHALLDGDATPAQGAGSLFVSLAVDAINEAFLDEIGDTVVEFDGEVPCLVEDYADDVRDILATSGAVSF